MIKFFTLVLTIFLLQITVRLHSQFLNNTDYDDDWKNPSTLNRPKYTFFRSSFIPSLPFNNATSPLVIPTYDHSGQGMHPCVIDFYSEHGKLTWGGYRYWMVMTPYPNFLGSSENPDMVASNDGIHWVAPKNLISPLNLPPKNGDDADPDMIYNPVLNELWVYFVTRVQFGNVLLIRVKENMKIIGPIVVNNQDSLICPVLWRESNSKWHMWAISVATQYLYHSSSDDGLSWGKFYRCLNASGKDPFRYLGAGYKVWHMGCKPNFKEQRMEFIFCARSYYSMSHPSNTPYLIYAQCPMDNPELIKTPISSPILIYSPFYNDWDNYKLYRTTFTITDVDTAYLYNIWYSACNLSGVWGIGLIHGLLGTTHTPSVIKTNTPPAVSPIANFSSHENNAREEMIKITLKRTFNNLSYLMSPAKEINSSSKLLLTSINNEGEKLTADDIRIYPNPASRFLHIELNPAVLYSPVSIAIFDLNGRQIDYFNNNNAANLIDLAKYSPGLYIVKINSPGTGFTYKIIITSGK